MTSRLETIPPELLDSIIDYIPRPIDLKALCLTSKTLRTHATPPLYRGIKLHKVSGWPKLEPGRGLLAEKNAGLSHVRALYGGVSDGDSEAEAQTFRLLLEALPQDTLEEIDWQTVPCDEETLPLLLTRQRKLVSLAIGRITLNLTPFLRLGVLGSALCTTLKVLDIPRMIYDIQDLEAYGYIIARAPLKALRIRTVFTGCHYNRGLADSQGLEGWLFGTLFSSSQSAPPKMLQLNELLLESIPIAHTQKSLTRYFDLSSLQVLRIYGCEGSAECLSFLTDHFKKHGSQLREFSHVAINFLDCSDIGEFLESFSGLRTLELNGRVPDGPLDIDRMKTHRETLEHFMYAVDFSPDITSNDAGMSQDFFSELGRHFRKLRQVAVGMPDTFVSVSSEDACDYQQALSQLLSLPQLKCLRICNWPLAKPKFFADPGPKGDPDDLNRSAYMYELDSFVESKLGPLFSSGLVSPPSPVLCYMAVKKNQAWNRSITVALQPACYVPTRQVDMFGRTQTVLQKTAVSAATYFEPETDVLVRFASEDK